MLNAVGDPREIVAVYVPYVVDACLWMACVQVCRSTATLYSRRRYATRRAGYDDALSVRRCHGRRRRPAPGDQSARPQAEEMEHTHTHRGLQLGRGGAQDRPASAPNQDHRRMAPPDQRAQGDNKRVAPPQLKCWWLVGWGTQAQRRRPLHVPRRARRGGRREGARTAAPVRAIEPHAHVQYVLPFLLHMDAAPSISSLDLDRSADRSEPKPRSSSYSIVCTHASLCTNSASPCPRAPPRCPCHHES